METNIEQIVEIVKQGGVIIYPTDTACGVGCRIDNEAAVARVYEIKGRELGKAVPVLCSSLEMVKKYIQSVSPQVEQLMEAHWPGAVTFVVQAKSAEISPLVLGKNNTIGVRIPGSDTIRSIIEKVGVPMVGTSANVSGEKTVYNTSDLDPKLREKVDMVLEGVCLQGNSSTILDVTQTPWKVLREGAVRIDLKTYGQ